MTHDDVRSIGLLLFVMAWFILPLLVRRTNRWMRDRETRELERPGFPVVPTPPTDAPPKRRRDN